MYLTDASQQDPKAEFGEQMSKSQVLRDTVAYLEGNNFLDPEDKQIFTLDKTLESVFGPQQRQSVYRM